MYDKQRLIELVQQLALKTGEFQLASGQTASYYLDCRRVSLAGEGAHLIGHGILEMIGPNLPQSVGGMAIGADPITAAVITVAWQQGQSLAGFIVRKETKQHGLSRAVEGPVEPGQTAVIVEDVVTTGGSALAAVHKAREFGLEVDRVICVVDRLAGGVEAFQKEGVKLDSLITIADLGISG